MSKSKLDSTFLLFDAAETSAVRSFVVLQLSDLVRQANRERPLSATPLTKILNALAERLLGSNESKWELRIAASDALSKVVEAASEQLQKSSEHRYKQCRVTLSQPFSVPNLDRLNVLEFVNSTTPLLAEDAVELPQLATSAPLSNVEVIRNNQLELDKRLGFVLPHQVLDSNITISQEDLPDFQQFSLKSPVSEFAAKLNPVRYLEHVSAAASVSDHEILETKRVKTEKIEDFDSDSGVAQDCNFLSMELSRLFLLFSQNVFNPSWQIRHGALLGLRSIMSLAIMSQSKVSLLIDHSAAQWLGTAIFCVIVADRFADYAAEEVTCPTQETAAQLLVYIAAVLSCKQSYDTIFSQLKIVLTELPSQQWSVLFGALSVLKYATALASLKNSNYWKMSDLQGKFFKELDSLLNGDSTEDDVRCLSCQIINNFINDSPNLFDLAAITRIKDATLQYLVGNPDSPSSVRCRYLALLGSLFEVEKTHSLTLATDSIDSETSLTKLLALMSDYMPQTRTSVLKLFSNMELLNSLELKTLIFAMHRIFSQLLIDLNPNALKETYFECWTAMCQRLGDLIRSVDDFANCQLAAELLNKLLCLAMQHPDLGFKPEMFAYSPENVPTNPRRYLHMGGEAVKNMAPPERHLFVVKLRLQGLGLLAFMVDKCLFVCGNEEKQAFFRLRLGEMLRFFSELRAGYPLFAFSIFITKHELLFSMAEESSEYIANRIIAILQDLTYTFEETIPLISLIRELCRQLLEQFKNAQITIQQMPEALLDMAAALVGVPVHRKPAAVVDAVEQLQSRLRVAIDEYNQLVLGMGRRTRLALTASWLSLTATKQLLPEKLNPIIHPVMSVLLQVAEESSNEKCSELLEIAADSIVAILFRCHLASRAPSPEVKIVKNILTQTNPAILSMVCRSAAVHLKEKLFSVLPSLVPLLQNPNPADEEEISFNVAEYLAPCCSEQDFEMLKKHVTPRICNKLMTSSVLGEVAAASKCMAAMAKRSPNEVMAVILKSFVLSSSSARYNQAPVLAASSLTELFADSVELKLYLVPFIRPVLSASVSVPRDCNLQQDSASRELAAKCLSSLVALLADKMDANMEPPPAMKADPDLCQMWSQSFDLLRWLRNPSSIPPVDIKSLKGLNADVSLRHYQLEGVTWLSFLQQNGLHGVLADDLGLGKTLQALCLLALDHQQARSNQRPSLILCPSTLLHHWEYEITKFFANFYLRPIVYSGSPAERRRVAEKGYVDANVVVISSYDVFRHDASSFFLTRSFRYCILDEGHVIRNAKSKLFQSLCRLDCSHRLVLTGTPVHNTVGDLWALFEFLMPGYLGSAKEFSVKYTKPITAASSPKASEKDINLCKERLELLHRATLPFVLRRLKTEVLQELPAKVIQDVFCDMTSVQADLYHTLLGGARQQHQSIEMKISGEEAEIKHVFQLIRALRLVCNHPCLVRKNNAQLLSANYSGKFAVLRRLLVDLNILDDQDSEKGTSDSDAASDNQANDAGAQFLGGHRVLLFCQESACLRLIEELFLKPLASQGLTWLRMDSQQTPAERFQTAVRFNNDPNIDILLLTTRVGGQGLNLTGADTVIFFDSDWNPQQDLQAMDRAHRIGQQRTVHVFRLVTRASIEERVMSLQRFKLNVADSVVNADNANVLEALSAADLYDLVFGSATAPISSTRSTGNDDGNEDAGEYETVSSATKAPSSSSSRSLKEVVGELGDLWPEEEYSAEFDFKNFLSRFSTTPSSQP